MCRVQHQRVFVSENRTQDDGDGDGDDDGDGDGYEKI